MNPYSVCGVVTCMADAFQREHEQEAFGAI